MAKSTTRKRRVVRVRDVLSGLTCRKCRRVKTQPLCREHQAVVDEFERQFRAHVLPDIPMRVDLNMAKNPHAVALGKLGGRPKTAKKAAAARVNGKKGGRPRKPKPDPEKVAP